MKQKISLLGIHHDSPVNPTGTAWYKLVRLAAQISQESDQMRQKKTCVA